MTYLRGGDGTLNGLHHASACRPCWLRKPSTTTWHEYPSEPTISPTTDPHQRGFRYTTDRGRFAMEQS